MTVEPVILIFHNENFVNEEIYVIPGQLIKGNSAVSVRPKIVKEEN
ncbi:hypothetical protein KN1_24180 [Stygiolobus caldivivus]|uniref:Uncharacterized protein n=1 Tax=Stygiolobus caldivivus TaxID=2824673 RepID=A0A8D5U9B8_9CREN|nr:hypothetical protein KN1_24180 [Stygiolobus caldivivus]